LSVLGFCVIVVSGLALFFYFFEALEKYFKILLFG